MKFYLNLYLLFIFAAANAQKFADKSKLQEFNNCKTQKCKITQSFVLAEYYLEVDDIQSSQKWLSKTKDLVSPKQNDTTTVYIHSLQSELFYYDGLFQFGTNEAEKAIQKAKQLQDNSLIANAYFFKGINQVEMNELKEAEKSFWKAKAYQPEKNTKSSIRSSIQNEHIFNNIAQLKLIIQQTDSAVWYNTKAYLFAKKTNSKRGIPNIEQTFGQIYLEEKKMDSAVFYFQKSILSAQKSHYFDIVLLNYGFLIQCFENNKIKNNQWFEKGLELIHKKNVNATFQHYFFKIALNVFKKTNQIEKLSIVQEKLINNNEEIRLKGNLKIQNITEQYAKNENKLLNFQIEELIKKRKYTFLQLIAALLGILLSVLFIIIIRRKNKVQQTLLNQKNDISKDLHDDIGSGLSSILIHADLLLKDKNAGEKQKVLATKIVQTGKEISQQLNTFIWSLSTDNNGLQSFTEYVKQYGVTLLESTNIEFEFTTNIASKEALIINGAQRKHLFLCVKELLNNAVKHAKAQKIEISIKVNDKNILEIIVADNGSGMNKENQFGNGITNIKRRIELLGGKVNFAQNDGLQITLTIPLK